MRNLFINLLTSCLVSELARLEANERFPSNSVLPLYTFLKVLYFFLKKNYLLYFFLLFSGVNTFLYFFSAKNY